MIYFMFMFIYIEFNISMDVKNMHNNKTILLNGKNRHSLNTYFAFILLVYYLYVKYMFVWLFCAVYILLSMSACPILCTV